MTKKLLFIATAAAAFSAAPAFAQDYPSPTLDNSAKITQTGDRNNATINQAVGGVLNGSAEAEILQQGNRNTASVKQQNLQAMTARFANITSVTQITTRATANVHQIHDYGTFGNNRATVNQRRSDSVATINQRGDRNTATIRQLAPAVAPIASISQNGLRNTATVEQRSNLGQVVVEQGTFSTLVGTSPDSQWNEAMVLSSGTSPDIYVRQGGNDNYTNILEDGHFGRIDVNNYGEFNDVIITQSSSNGIVDVFTQTPASFNYAEVIQAASDYGSEALINQSGDYSEALISQADPLSLGGENQADITQTGNATAPGGILSEITQSGADNRASTAQASSIANSVITQTGTAHQATVTQ
jgi:hypothetical protein